MPKPSEPAGTPEPRRGKLARGLMISLVVLALLVVLFEIVPRVVPIPGLRAAELDPYTESFRESRIEPHPYLAYANRPSFARDPKGGTPTHRDPRVRHNSLGFRGPETTWEKPAGTYRILCLGGSSTYGIGPSTDETNWPMRLQEHLNASSPPHPVEVINGGCQGYSTFEMAIQLELRGLDFRPDLVLLYETINDVRCALYPNVKRDNTHWRANWPVAKRAPLDAALEKSLTYRAWRRYLTDWWIGAGALGTYVIVDFGKHADDYLQPTDPELGFNNIRRNLVTIVGTARAHGADALIVTQGMRFDDLAGRESRDLQIQAFERVYQILGEVANERGVPYCEARRVLEAEAARQLAEKLARGETGPNGGPPIDDVFTSEVHMTDAGCDLLARTIAARIVELGLLR